MSGVFTDNLASKVRAVVGTNTKTEYCTSGMQSGWDTTATISSSGSKLWHFISVYTFFPIVQHARSFTSSTWYLKKIIQKPRYQFTVDEKCPAVTDKAASHKSNPSCTPQGYRDSNSILPLVMWRAVTDVEGIPCWGFFFVSRAMANTTDVLQPNRLIVLTLFPSRVWTFPSLPTGAPTSPHDARDPCSERWNYVGENLTGNFAWDHDFHVNSGIFYMPWIYDMGPTALLPFRRKVCWGFFCPEKSWRLRSGLNPRTWVL